MLQRRTAPNGVVYYASSLMEQAGVPHAFSTRIGGVSTGAFDSLNLGNPGPAGVKDPEEQVQENYRRLHQATGLEHRRRCWVHQVHGADVAMVRRGQAFESGQPADALVCDDPDRCVAVRVADCVPILLASEDGRVVAAVHAGWRGVVANVVGAAITRMRRAFADLMPEKLLAAVGPCIGAEAFEVGPEVVQEFRQAFGDAAPVHRQVGEKAFLDLRQAVRGQLVQAGVRAGHIEITERCTYRHRDEFFSHRREQGLTGRMAALIAPR